MAPRRGDDDLAVTTTRRLLTCGAIAGPLFLAVLLGQALWRPGFELGAHAISLLSRGDLGWVQVTAFVLSGLLVVAAGAGVRRAVPGATGSAAGWSVVVMGTGLVLTGIFVVDPGVGFPPGGPAPVATPTWQGALHDVGTALVLNGGVAAALMLAWYAFRIRAMAAAVACLVAAVAVAALAWWSGPGVPFRVTGAAIVLTVWITAASTVLRGSVGRGGAAGANGRRRGRR